MLELRPFEDLGTANHGWLQAKHHFSFAHYYDPQRMDWGSLRVWNDDEIQTQTGFPPHPHQDMEIITYVREGAISHQDSLGNKGRTQAGDVQVMSAGTGIVHSEYNLEPELTKIFQIWIQPNQKGNQPSWGTRPFPKQERSGRFVVLASGFATDTDALPIRTDARVAGATLTAGAQLDYTFPHPQRYGYLVVAKGQIEVQGTQGHKVAMQERDGLAIHQESGLSITALADSELVLVDAS